MHTGDIGMIVMIIIDVVIQDTAEQVLNVFRRKAVTCHGNVTGAVLVAVIIVMAVSAMVVSAMVITRSIRHDVMTITVTVLTSVLIPLLVASFTSANASYQGGSRRVQVFHRQLAGTDNAVLDALQSANKRLSGTRNVCV
jgi:protein-S-isoprenylcysteine O-methyltransferase Ste14